MSFSSKLVSKLQERFLFPMCSRRTIFTLLLFSIGTESECENFDISNESDDDCQRDDISVNHRKKKRKLVKVT